MSATLIAVLVDIAIGLAAWRRVSRHEASDAVVHGELRARLAGIEGAVVDQSSPVGFSIAKKG